MTTDYQAFLATKALIVPSVGKPVDEAQVNELLFPFQRRLVAWACNKGRAGLFATTGLGKTFMQVEWARLMAEKTLIIAPLSVVRQTIKEAAKLGIEITYSRDGGTAGMIIITNYEMVDKFDPALFGAVVLDESSILKSLSGATRKLITEMFATTPYKLCCTATPAPNDIVELGSHAEFLNVLQHNEMLATFFVHSKDLNRGGASSTDGWKLKNHARKPFFRWLASWAISVRRPSDLDYPDDGYILPALNFIPHWIEYEYMPEGQMFGLGLKGVSDRANVRKATISLRCEEAARIINDTPEQWIAWVGRNDEETALHALIPDSKVITGSMSPEEKLQLLSDFQDGVYRVLITKTSIAGYGVNLQNCHQQVFVGMNDSYEDHFQAVRRCWRYGQQHPVNIHIVLTSAESPIYSNVKRKESEAEKMSDELIHEVRADQLAELSKDDGTKFVYKQDDVVTDRYHLMLGDTCERIGELADNSVDLTVTSPPFGAGMYVYNPSERDLSNSRGIDEFFEHFRFIIRELYRVTKPGRNACIHIMQLPATKNFHGFIGLVDFHGMVIRAFIEEGWHFYGEAVIQKNPQVQAQRTKKLTLLFRTLRHDSSQLAPGIPDYLLIFKKPGDNEIPVTPIENGEMNEEDWIKWAHPIWVDIKETQVLNRQAAKDDPDEKHIAPLQLEVIKRAVIMFSNPNELVYDPFGGIGSTGYVAVENGRRAVMCELKQSYFKLMTSNMLEAARHKPTLFDLLREHQAANGNGNNHQVGDIDLEDIDNGD